MLGDVIMANERTNMHYTFCIRLKEQRKKIGLTQDDISQELEIAKRTYQKWEAGDSQPDALILPRLCELLDCDFNYLIGKISTPHDTRQIEEITGLTYEAIETLKFLNDGLKERSIHPRMADILNATNYLLSGIDKASVLSLIGEYLFHDYSYIKSQDGKKMGNVIVHDELTDQSITVDTKRFNDMILFHIQDLLKLGEIKQWLHLYLTRIRAVISYHIKFKFIADVIRKVGN